jgi:hypothetical protein
LVRKKFLNSQEKFNHEVNKVEKESGVKDIDDKLKEFKNTVK